MRFNVTGRHARPIEGNIKIDPSVFRSPVVYTNVITGEETRFALEVLPLGFDRVSPGKFYFTFHPLAYFYCDAIKSNLIHWILVEMFQTGDMVQATLTQELKYSRHYIPVTDKKNLNRLQARLDDYRSRVR